MKRLVAKEYVSEKDGVFQVRKGHRYSYFVDLETGKYYEPVDGFEITSDADMSDRFFNLTEQFVSKVEEEYIKSSLPQRAHTPGWLQVVLSFSSRESCP